MTKRWLQGSNSYDRLTDAIASIAAEGLPTNDYHLPNVPNDNSTCVIHDTTNSGNRVYVGMQSSGPKVRSITRVLKTVGDHLYEPYTKNRATSAFGPWRETIYGISNSRLELVVAPWASTNRPEHRGFGLKTVREFMRLVQTMDALPRDTDGQHRYVKMTIDSYAAVVPSLVHHGVKWTPRQWFEGTDRYLPVISTIDTVYVKNPLLHDLPEDEDRGLREFFARYAYGASFGHGDVLPLPVGETRMANLMHSGVVIDCVDAGHQLADFCSTYGFKLYVDIVPFLSHEFDSWLDVSKHLYMANEELTLYRCATA